MRLKNKTVILLLLLTTFFTSLFIFDRTSAAEYGYGGSGGTSGGYEERDRTDYFNCGYDGYWRCPRWILTTKEAYDIIRNDTSRWSSYNYYLPECKTDSYIMIAGNRAQDGSLLLFNFLGSGLWEWNRKTSHNYTSWAPDIWTVWDYDGDRIFDWTDGIPGGNTWGWLLNEVLSTFSVSETDLAAFCPSMVLKEHSLTAYAIDDKGNPLYSGNSIGTTTGTGTLSVYINDDVISQLDAEDYEFTGEWKWCYGENGNCEVTTNNYSGSSSWKWSSGDAYCSNAKCFWSGYDTLTEKNAYAIFKLKHVVRGKSDVGSNSTGWQVTDKTANTLFLDNCSPTSGCKVTFTHSLRRDSGTKNTSYSIKRESNYWHSPLGVEPKNPLLSNSNQSFTKNGVPIVVNTEELTLYPGQVVCERMTFNSYPGTNKNATTTACASALGNAQPDNPSNQDTPEDPDKPSGDSSFINIKVRNQDVDAYNQFQRTVYAKPEDKLIYRATYNPVLQYTYYLVPQKMRINSGTIIPASGINTSSTLATLFNNNKGSSLKNWGNGFTIYSNPNFFTTKYYPYTVGSQDKRTEQNEYVVTYSRVGSSLDETAKTNHNNSQVTTTTPSQVSFSNNSGNNLGDVKTASIYKTASAIVPYNFTNTTTISGPKPYVFAGEESSFSVKLDTNPRQNNITDGYYATISRDSKYKVELCYKDSCTWTEEITNASILNPSGKKDGDSTTKNVNLIMPDGPAGGEVCLRSAVYPKDSYSNTNINSQAYDSTKANSWAYSPKTCFDIAKKPSLEIWGGNVYSSGDINTATSKKKNLAGYNDSNTHKFGSWGELGIIASGKVTGLSSGAGLGYNGLGLVHTPGGSISNSFCDDSTLSFANPSELCSVNNGSVGEINLASANNPAANTVNKDRDSIINKFSFKDGENNSNVIYDYNAGDFEVGSQEIAKSTIKVYQSDGTITITGNINYEDAAYSFTNNSGSKAGDYIPKLLIIAKNINIACNVNRIDGVLLAESTVTTSKCEGSEDINARVNSNPLRINGAVIAGRIIPNRTYGAGPGNNSMISAETINFDPSLYLWGQLGDKDDAGDEPEGGSEGENGEKSNLTITSSREIAPRL